jgi:hypothetical protein
MEANGQRWGWWQKWLSWRQITTEMVGAGNNQQNAAVAVAAAVTVVFVTAILAAWPQQRW